MTTANFAAYDYIVITSGNTSAAYLAIYETRATWSAAVNGRMVVTGADASVHTTYSATFLRAAFSWLATGPGTGLFVESDVGARSLDFMQSFGPLTVANSSGNAVTLVQPTHPVMAGSTSTSLSTWNQSYHQYFTTIAPFYLPLADAAQSNAQHVHMVRDAQCLP